VLPSAGPAVQLMPRWVLLPVGAAFSEPVVFQLPSPVAERTWPPDLIVAAIQARPPQSST
jgi:hypothetical protein